MHNKLTQAVLYGLLSDGEKTGNSWKGAEGTERVEKLYVGVLGVILFQHWKQSRASAGVLHQSEFPHEIYFLRM